MGKKITIGAGLVTKQITIQPEVAQYPKYSNFFVQMQKGSIPGGPPFQTYFEIESFKFECGLYPRGEQYTSVPRLYAQPCPEGVYRRGTI